ncbi:RNA polymerase sigma factor [Heyndrickxia sp. FSL W8-0423]|uniref:RNA polymerase sigma factor n=1 Tax=Heyndrickxia sp. FSL W8-0423 TaxID=2921601 RepID=UPI0030FB9092
MGGYSIEELFQKYEQDITSYLIYYTGSADVEDLVQDTFLLAMKNLSNFKENSHPKTWLISIARNIVIDKFRRRLLGVPSGKCGFTTLSPFSRRFPQF